MIEGTSPVENHLSYALAAAHRSLTPNSERAFEEAWSPDRGLANSGIS